MKIREAKVEDIDSLCELLKELFTLEEEFCFDEALHKEGLKKIIEDPKIGVILLVEVDKKVVAMLNLLYTISTALGSKVAILEDMVVLEEFRAKGFGSKLIDFAKEYGKKDGCKRVTLLTDSINYKAQEFYKKSGFTKSKMVAYRAFL